MNGARIRAATYVSWFLAGNNVEVVKLMYNHTYRRLSGAYYDATKDLVDNFVITNPVQVPT